MNRMELAHKSAIKQRVMELLRRPMSFTQILRNSLNADPHDLWISLAELQDEGTIITRENGETKYLIKDLNSKSTCDIKEQDQPHENQTNDGDEQAWLENFLNELPYSSPVYSQWWYLDTTYKKLVRFMDGIKKKNSTPLFLGSPTLGSIYSEFTKSHCVIADIDEEILSFCCDTTNVSSDYINYDVNVDFEETLEERFDFVWSDPPWSSRLLKLFMLRAIQAAKEDGTIVLSLPQKLTRPGIEEERKNLYKLVYELGCEIVSYLPRFTHYELPNFEKNAYSQVGIELKKHWRTGDVLVLRKERKADYTLYLEIENSTLNSRRWEQLVFGKSRIFSRLPLEFGHNAISSFILSLTKPTIPTVSSRNNYFELVDVITTNNTFFRGLDFVLA
jgi:dGTPase